MEAGKPSQTGGRKEPFPPPTIQKIFLTTICEGFRTGKEDHYYALSIRNTIVAAMLLAFIPMIIPIVAMFIAKQAQELDLQGNRAEAERKATLAKNLNIAAYITTLIYAMVFWVGIVIVAAAVAYLR